MNWTQIDKIDLGRFVKGYTGRLDKLASLENWLGLVLTSSVFFPVDSELTSWNIGTVGASERQ